MEENHEDVEDVGDSSSDSFIDDSEDDGPSTSGRDDDELQMEATEEEIEEIIAELLEVESKAAEAQETLEKESLAKVEGEVREELAQTLNGDELETAVADEMATFIEEWEALLDKLETESAHLQEQLDGAGIELPSLYKWIESQAPTSCSTDAWQKRIHWIGSQVTCDLTESKAHAEEFLQSHRPVRRRHGKLLEEGASGFLQKKLTVDGSNDDVTDNSEVDWSSLNKLFSEGTSKDCASFGSKSWASVYLASTPQQAAEMGLKFPGVNEVEEIDDIDGDSTDPFVAAAVANEKELALSEEQNKNYRKVKEEDDANFDRKLQKHLKRRRYRKSRKQGFSRKDFGLVDELIESDINKSPALVGCSASVPNDNESGIACHNSKTDFPDGFETSNVDKGISMSNGTFLPPESALPDSNEPRGSKHKLETEEPDIENKRSRTVVRDNDDESTVKVEDQADLKENAGEFGADNLNEKFHCTACNKIAVKVHPHPLLKVIVCADCKAIMEEKMRVMDPDCAECYCGWCGRSTDLVNCKSCKMFFCMICIKGNIGTECLSEVQNASWQCCCCCRPGLLQKLTLELEKAMVVERSIDSSSESDSDNSDADVDVALSSKRKRKKKIRRILDDAELGEETKRKIAIEKERQERLKSLQVQFSSGSKVMSSAGFNGNLSEDASTEVLGDASKGYIVNVVREKGEEAVRIPPSISAKLKVHQIAGIRFMWENIIQSVRKVKSGDRGLGCILAHTMGLGKTLQVIALLYTAMRCVDLGLRTVLIVVPVNVLHNWRKEFLKWKPSEVKPLRVFMLEDVSRERRGELLAKWRAKGGVFLIGYAAFRNLSFGKNVKDRNMAREICYALQDGPDILVCDEAHVIKNTRADVTQALKQVKCQRRIALTGSPLQNNLMDFQNPIENGQHTNSTLGDVKIMNQRSHILYEQLKGFVQRMDMAVVKTDLPPKTVFVIAVKLSPLQRKLYKRFLDVHGFTNYKVSSENIGKRSFFAGYQALAQIWNHPGILQLKKDDKDSVRREDAIENFLADESSKKQKNLNGVLPGKNDDGLLPKGWWNNLLHEKSYKEIDYSGKMVLLLDILAMSSNVGDKALVFSQSILTLDLIELYLSKLSRPGEKGKFWKKGKDWYRLDGRTESSERQKLVESFNDPLNERVKCCLISTRAGSLGINLHAANRVIIVDGSWNPTYDLQAIYRAWRYGQKKPVFAYRLMAHGTMEEKIYKRQVTKEGLAARVVDRQQVHRTMSKEEMLHLFEFGDDENPDNLTNLDHENGHAEKLTMSAKVGILPKQKMPATSGSCSSDKLMESLLGKHSPSWIANYHEHETLLQENEEEKLSKEEQDMAWEVYRKTFEWEEVQRVPLSETATEQNQPGSKDAPEEPDTSSFRRSNMRNHVVPRKCTNLAHMLTLRSQGTKSGCSTVCGECAQEISWETLNRDGRTSK
ncbi:Transcriptional regulator ATRX-like protein [Morus notabilis]|uniref:ATP-dependent helicase ATRX n=1 Tax=Morus notabilis TaxID=981085 RepID=W9S6N2_9ROSA|nr:Transcriptional regulator ATRX-like protein [Morus notabilis]